MEISLVKGHMKTFCKERTPRSQVRRQTFQRLSEGKVI